MPSAARHPYRTTTDYPRDFLSIPSNPKNPLNLFIPFQK